jgi:hypothetical protein
VKDLVSFVLSWGIIYQQVLIGPVDGRVLALAGALLGVPGLSVVLPRLLAAIGSAGTTGPGSGSAESDSPS